jgi:hypothetical protein
MPDLIASSEIERYMKSVAGSSVRILKQSVLAKPGKKELKGYGYGTPILVEYEVQGRRERAVVHTVRPGPFGHEHMADRAQSLLWDHAAFNTLPRHVRSIDVGAFRTNGTAVSLGDAQEFFTLTTYGEGEPYANDLERIRESGELKDGDLERADALCDYLVEIHSVKHSNDDLYVRRIRELIGHSECIMGLIDSYPKEALPAYADKLKGIEQQCIDWRWKLKSRVHRLRQVHGDFHPWNILFSNDAEFCLLDRSRGEWGDPADDVTCLTMNYFFFSLQRHGRLTGAFEKLFLRFWDRYLEGSRDSEILQVAAPFLVFRSLVLAHPVWYPQLTEELRTKLFRFMEGVLHADLFDPRKTHDYCRT